MEKADTGMGAPETLGFITPRCFICLSDKLSPGKNFPQLVSRCLKTERKRERRREGGEEGRKKGIEGPILLSFNSIYFFSTSGFVVPKLWLFLFF